LGKAAVLPQHSKYKLGEKTMPRKSTKKAKTIKGLNLKRAGMPALDLISSAETKIKSKQTGKTYRIIKTAEIDEYEVGLATEAITPKALASFKKAASIGDNFKGKARKAAKISIADAPIRKYKEVRTLIKSLPKDDDMKNHQPPIKTTQSSNRVEEEKRNIRVKAFLYAASKEDDNDFHLILGRDPNLTPEIYMNMELSGLPPTTSPHFAKLNEARDAFKNFFGNNLPGAKYFFYDPPIPVLIEGSLFFDMNHATGQKPGPQSLRDKIPTIWEVHPITKMVFEP
jgi:hypothetical protein